MDIFLTRRLSKSLAFCEFASVNFEPCYGKGKENCNLSESTGVFLEDMHLMTDPLRYFKGSMKKKVN